MKSLPWIVAGLITFACVCAAMCSVATIMGVVAYRQPDDGKHWETCWKCQWKGRVFPPIPDTIRMCPRCGAVQNAELGHLK